jgi:hypothetical protein
MIQIQKLENPINQERLTYLELFLSETFDVYA